MTSVYQHKLPIWPTLGASYREWRRMLAALRQLVINAFLIILAISVLDQFIPARLADQELFGTAITLVEAAMRAFLLTPILIAIHRFIILDEITKTYAVPLGEPALRRFFAWLFAFEVLAGFPLDFLGALQALNVTLTASAIGFAAALVVAVALMVRLSILPPAIAVEAPGARLASALEDTKGSALRIFHDRACVRRHFANGLADFDGRHCLALVHRARDACAAPRSSKRARLMATVIKQAAGGSAR
jgi:hypothetical protein